MSDTRMMLGAQTEAARAVTAAIDPVASALERLGGDLQASSVGFRGQAATGLATALEEWYAAAGDLLPTLQSFAQKLVETDVAEAQADAAQQERFARLAGRLGGGQP